MEKITKDILKFLNNNHTKVIEKEDFNGNYYSYLMDTVYLSKNGSKGKMPKEITNINKMTENLVVICHECIHSVQNKMLHLSNVVLSNLSIVLSLLCTILTLFGRKNQTLNCCALAVILFSITIRSILELDAIHKSTKLARNIAKHSNLDVTIQDIEKSEKYINKHKYMALIQMIKDKLIILAIIALIIII